MQETIDVYVTNESGETWRWGKDARPEIRLGYRWSLDGNRVHEPMALRTPLPADIRPGETHFVPVHVVPPSQPGRYELQLDVLHEGFGCFGSTAKVALEVRERELVALVGPPGFRHANAGEAFAAARGRACCTAWQRQRPSRLWRLSICSRPTPVAPRRPRTLRSAVARLAAVMAFTRSCPKRSPVPPHRDHPRRTAHRRLRRSRQLAGPDHRRYRLARRCCPRARMVAAHDDDARRTDDERSGLCLGRDCPGRHRRPRRTRQMAGRPFEQPDRRRTISVTTPDSVPVRRWSAPKQQAKTSPTRVLIRLPRSGNLARVCLQRAPFRGCHAT